MKSFSCIAYSIWVPYRVLAQPATWVLLRNHLFTTTQPHKHTHTPRGFYATSGLTQMCRKFKVKHFWHIDFLALLACLERTSSTISKSILLFPLSFSVRECVTMVAATECLVFPRWVVSSYHNLSLALLPCRDRLGCHTAKEHAAISPARPEPLSLLRNAA